MSNGIQERPLKRALGAAVLFYLLIAFEFFYMAGPFAIYFYAVYRPWLNFLCNHPQFAWLSGFFLPHVVAETSSMLINARNVIGIVFAAAGFVSFCLGAGYVYYYKIAGKGPVTTGIYKYIRHPQYLSLSLCGLGMLLLWPRYIVLFAYVTMLFVYYFLARIEEKECLSRFGKPYVDYINRTWMFVPSKVPFISRLPSMPESRPLKALTVIGAYGAALLVAFGAALGLQRLSEKSLYTYCTKDSVSISVVQMDSGQLKRLMETALLDERVRERLTIPNEATRDKFLNYILPEGWSVSEIPMKTAEGNAGHHFLRKPSKTSVYNIIFTRAVLREPADAGGMAILPRTVRRIPLAEVVVDAVQGVVVRIDDPVAKEPYGDLPLPLY